MMPLDLLCSAIWAPEPTWLRTGGIPRHAVLPRSGDVCTAGISCIRARVLNFCSSEPTSPAISVQMKAFAGVLRRCLNPRSFLGQRHFDLLNVLRKSTGWRLLLRTGRWILTIRGSRRPWKIPPALSQLESKKLRLHPRIISLHRFSSLFANALNTQLLPIHLQPRQRKRTEYF